MRTAAPILLAALLLAGPIAKGVVQPATNPEAPKPDANLIRVWGFDGMKPLLLRWEAAYTKEHPEIHFLNTLHGPASAMAGLYNGVADIVVMGRELWPVDTMAYRWVFQRQPFGIAVVTAGLNAPAQAFTPIVIVNRKNPLASISLARLDAIYGSEHRAAAANARTWGDLGLTGEWADKPIHAYGYGPEDALGVYFRHDVLRSDFKPSLDSHLLSDRDRAAEHENLTAAERIAHAVALDPDAIGYTKVATLRPTLKTIAVEGATPPAISADTDTLTTHRYPLTRTLSLFVNRAHDKPLSGAVNGFLRYVLSPEAQAEVQSTEGFLPLTPALAQHELQRLDAPMPPEPKAGAEDNQ
jgi:phosphate transport system substrate-binding protein